MFDAGKARMIGLPYGEKTDDMLSRFHLIPERYGRTERRTDRRTDRQTNRFAISISRVDKNTVKNFQDTNEVGLKPIIKLGWITTIYVHPH